MAEIGFWTVPLEGTPARKRLDEYMEKNRGNQDHQRLLQARFKKAQALVAVQGKNGAGLSADRQLREFNLEYNGRVFNGSLRDLPSSFNVAEAFNKFLPPSATFELRTERDHLFSFEHFIDWVTSEPDAPSSRDLTFQSLVEGYIYSYSSTDRPSNLLFKCENSKEFGFASISLVRLGGEVSVLLVAGQKADLDLETQKIRSEYDQMQPHLHRTHIQPDASLSQRAEPLVEDPKLWKTVVLLRFDTEHRTVDARYVFHDCGNAYNGTTDDVSAFIDANGDFFSDDVKEAYERQSSVLDAYESLVELCKTCLLLPVFFESNEDDIEIQRHPTEFREFKSLLKNKKAIDQVDANHWITHRDVRYIRKPAARSADRSTFNTPEFKIERSGYWRKLPHGSEGRDKVGRPIYGRTWVSQTLSWEEYQPRDGTVSVSRTISQPPGSNPGFIYVMRSAAHHKEIFKVGLTRRTADERSAELSRTTGSPDHFLVVEEWATGDCVRAEQLIHAELDQYRINPNREFFSASYRIIRAAVDKVIASI